MSSDAKNLIQSFESHEGLDPDREVNEHNEVDPSELGRPGITSRLASLFGDRIPTGRYRSRKEADEFRKRTEEEAERNRIEEERRNARGEYNLNDDESSRNEVERQDGRNDDRKDERQGDRRDDASDDGRDDRRDDKRDDRRDDKRDGWRDNWRDDRREERRDDRSEERERRDDRYDGDREQYERKRAESDERKRAESDQRNRAESDQRKRDESYQRKRAESDQRKRAESDERKRYERDGSGDRRRDDKYEKAQSVQGTEERKRDPPTSRKTRVLVVYAHVYKESYEGCLVGAAVKTLTDAGMDIQFSNLYEMGFNPVSSPRDFGGVVRDKEFYSYSLLAGEALDDGKLAQDIVAEQDKVAWADLILIVSQLQSHGLPALLKGWFDRIMTYNFAYSDGQIYEKGKMRGKKALLCLTTEALSSMYTPRGIHGDLNVYLWPLLNGVLRFAGFDVLKPQVYFGAGRASDDYREKAISTLRHRLKGIFDERGLSFIPVDWFNENDGYVLSDRDVDELEKKRRLTVGQHAGRQVDDQLAYIVEPDKRKETAEAEKLKQAATDTKRPWYTYW